MNILESINSLNEIVLPSNPKSRFFLNHIFYELDLTLKKRGRLSIYMTGEVHIKNKGRFCNLKVYVREDTTVDLRLPDNFLDDKIMSSVSVSDWDHIKDLLEPYIKDLKSRNGVE